MSLKSLIPLLVVALTGVSLSVAPAQALTLQEYLDQVKGENRAYQGSRLQSEGATQKAREADLIFTPSLFAEGRVGHDGKLSSPSIVAYDRVENSSYKLGVSQQFRFGLQSKLYYDLSKTRFVGANLGPNVQTEYWDASPKLELNMPLWSGGFGRAARATEELLREQNSADHFSSAAQASQSLVGAEAAYWKLSAWKDVVRIQEQALKAAQDIHDYVARKQKMNLGEKADVIQAQALVEARTLELQVAQNEARDALRTLNKFRNKAAETPAEALDAVDLKALENLQVPEARPGDRLDVKATEAQLASAKAQAQLVRERNRPTLDVYGTYALNGRDAEMNEALKNAGQSERDTAFVGVKLNIPLNMGASADARAGALKAQKAAELNQEYAKYAQEMDWTTLSRTLSEARDNLRLIGRIEEVQKIKVENERARLRQGRTTTYQVLLFEQDYTQAAANRAKSAAQILGLQSQLKLYQNTNSSEEGK